MANSFVAKYIGDLEKKDVISDDTNLIVVDATDGKQVPWTVLKEYFLNSIEEANTYQPGDYFSLKENVMIPGMLSGSSKTIVFSVLLDKSIDASGVNITCEDLTARGINGYLIIDTDIHDGNYTVSHSISGNTVTVLVTASTAFGTANNTPLIVEGNMLFEFY